MLLDLYPEMVVIVKKEIKTKRGAKSPLIHPLYCTIKTFLLKYHTPVHTHISTCIHMHCMYCTHTRRTNKPNTPTGRRDSITSSLITMEWSLQLNVWPWEKVVNVCVCVWVTNSFTFHCSLFTLLEGLRRWSFSKTAKWIFFYWFQVKTDSLMTPDIARSFPCSYRFIIAF